MDLLRDYIVSLRDKRSYGAGTKETSYYPCLVNLLDAVGASLKPKVGCLSILQNTGAGNPDGGLFDKTQMQKGSQEPRPGQLPSRGVIEIKSTKDDAWFTAGTKQVSKYWKQYGQVLVTNYRDFLLMGKNADGSPAKLEGFRLAPTEEAFWHGPIKGIVDAHGERFMEFLTRVMLHPVALQEPKDVAWFLASYARDARARVKAVEPEGRTTEGEAPSPLAPLRRALEESLGLTFAGEKGDHFFHSTLVQTLFYGVFSAWVLWHKEKPGREDRFSWKEAEWTLHVPMIRALFEQVARPSALGPLGLVEVLDWTEAVLNRVDRPAFFARFQEAEAVQYFYEPFLEAFDPELRKELGVWYTPPEIVKYMVARVDTVLKSELGLADGLADERVVVLDPCCGTGAYLVEVLRRVHADLAEKEGPALAARAVKKAATSRVFGFEILPAPFVVSHLQLGLYLQGLGAPFKDEKDERAGVYLTNALTGWEPPKEPKKHLPFPELEAERDAAEQVKREAPILVILGNPPYNGFAGVAVEEERDLSTAYKTTKQAPPPQGQGLNDLYVRFFRMAERRIAEVSGQGVVCFISNYSWLDGLSFTGMREKYLGAFDRIWVDCLNGDKYKTGKLTPEGEPDPSVFSTPHNHEGIQVGTAIATLVKRAGEGPHDTPGHVIARSGEAVTWQSCPSSSTPSKTRSLPGSSPDEALAMTGNGSPVHFRHLWGKAKLARLEAEATQAGTPGYEAIKPPLGLGLPFMPATVSAGYLACPKLPDLFPVSFPGVKTSRDEFLVDVDREALRDRLTLYFDPSISHDEMRRRFPSVMTSTARFNAEDVRDTLRKRGILLQNLVRYCYRPFDVRWLYWEPEAKLLDEKRPEYFPHVWDGNPFCLTTGRTRKSLIEPAMTTGILTDLNCMDSGARGVPLFLSGGIQSEGASSPSLNFGDTAGNEKTHPNLATGALAYLKSLGATPEDLFFHALTVMHSPIYRTENVGALRLDWPRIPLPSSRDTLEHSAALGREVAALLDTERDVPGVTSGAIRPELKAVGILSALPGEAVSLAVTAGWGHAGQGGVTMPGKGKVSPRPFTPSERKGLGEAAARLGGATVDVYLNDTTFFANVPEAVWNYTLGGYQVLKKWLSYREQSLLGRPLLDEEARHFMNTVRRITALKLLEKSLDQNYQETISSLFSWGV